MFDHLGDASGSGVRRGLRHQLPRHAERPSDQVLVRARQPRHRPEVQRRRPRQLDVPRDPLPGEDPLPPELPQPAQLTTEGLPAAHRLPRRPGLRPHHRRVQPADPAVATSTRPTTTRPGSPSAASGPPTAWAASNFGFALRGSYSYQPANNLRSPIRRARRSTTKRTCRVWPWAAGSTTPWGISTSASTTPTSIWACSARRTSSPSASAGDFFRGPGRERDPQGSCWRTGPVHRRAGWASLVVTGGLRRARSVTARWDRAS